MKENKLICTVKDLDNLKEIVQWAYNQGAIKKGKAIDLLKIIEKLKYFPPIFGKDIIGFRR